MKKLVLTVTLMATLASLAEAQQTPDPRVADLVQAGKIRVGVHSVMYTKDPQTGELQGASVGIILLDIARALSARIGAEIVPVGHPTIPEMLTCLTAGACDMGFMGPDPSRTGVDFSPPILQLDYTFLVPAASSIQRIADVDRPGVRIAVVSHHASTLTLSRILKHAQLVYAATPDPTFELLRSGQADAFASVRGVLLEYSARLPGSRVLDERQGLRFLRAELPGILAKRSDVLSPRMLRVIEDLVQDWPRLDERIAGEIEGLAQQDQACVRLMTVPGIGPIISSAMVAAIGTGDVFCKGRDFGAWLGLVPKQISTGDRTILGSISKRGNRYPPSL